MRDVDVTALKSLRGKAAVIGIGETPHRRNWPGRTEQGLCAEAAAMAIKHAGLKKQDIDGLVTYGGVAAPAFFAEYMGMAPMRFASGVTMMGSSAGVALTVAAMAVNAGLCNYCIFVGGGGRDVDYMASTFGAGREGGTAGAAGAGPPSQGTEWETPFGPAVAANNSYGLLYSRHMHEYGSKPHQFAKMAVNKRFNAIKNPNAAFTTPITVDDVMNSRYVNYPLHLLECVMPVAGAVAYIVTTADRARAGANPPAWILGMGVSQGYSPNWLNPRMCETPVVFSSADAYRMAGYGPNEVQFAEFYD